ncbi:restriction endonuclease subunit S [Mycoplasmopsis felis]|uniref:restriction endonuclease subunit S n=1 Tax=Mycoplasmopsis felis TaxID=33923 RepID=UPI002AFEB6AD|nr:restriction endonuclease subunit S [Mycoplasmopsis felis]WQQ08999.1 restriction endonuclease subunit S [Mycoplasmopsis felis]
MKKVLVPKVRFKGFGEEWKEEKIESFSKITIGEFVIKTKQNDFYEYPVYNGGITNTGFYKEYNNEGNKIIVSARGANAGHINFIEKKYWAGNSCYSIDLISNRQRDIKFIFYSMLINKNKFDDNKQVGTIPSVSLEDVRNFIIYFASYSEQQKIGKLLDQISNLITLEQSKLNKLKQLKETLLQKMFPEGNSKTPRIRFKGFEGEWKEEKLEYIAKVTNGKSNTSDNNKWGQYNLYIRSEEIYKSNKYIFDVEGVITVGDGNIGKIFHYVNEKFDLHQRCYLIYEFQNIWPKYFYYYFSQNFYKRAILMSYTATVNSIRINTITDMDIMFPKELIEQQKIGDFFCKIDTLISLYQSKLNKLKQIKEALLQKLLI